VSSRIPCECHDPAADLDRGHPGAAGQGGYIADRSLATVLYLALRMGRPLFVEGEAGVGKTEIAKVLSQSLGRKLIPAAMLRGARRRGPRCSNGTTARR